MNKTTIGSILEQAGETKLRDIPVVLKALQMSHLIIKLSDKTPASEVYNQLLLNHPDVLDKTIADILKPPQANSITHNCKSIAMWSMMVLMSVAYTAVNIYIAFVKMEPVVWEDMLLPLIGPILIVLHERGVMSRENRETLAALTGKTPVLTMMDAVAQRIANPRNSKSNKDTYIPPRDMSREE